MRRLPTGYRRGYGKGGDMHHVHSIRMSNPWTNGEGAGRTARVSARLRRLFALMTLAFGVLVAYGAVEPGCDSVLIEAHGKDAYPWAWLATLPVLAAAVSLYAAYSRSVPLSVLFRRCVLVSAGLHLLLVTAVEMSVPLSSYALYIWKDVHIVVLLETVWAFASLVTPMADAKDHYGALLMVGSVGAVGGAMLTGLTVPWIGTTGTLYLPLGVFALLYGLGFVVPRWLGLGTSVSQASMPTDRFQGALDQGKRLRESPYLLLLLAMVVSVQVFITLVDFQYKASLEAAYPRGVSALVTSERTQYAAVIGLAKDGGAFVLQALTAPILRLAGAPVVLLMLPLLSGAIAAVGIGAPGLHPVALAKVVGKALDYSLFKAAKELLYIPLSYADKTRGKALVDMGGYRGAKSAVSVLLVVLAWSVGVDAGVVLGGALAAAIMWFVVSWILLRRFKKLASQGS